MKDKKHNDIGSDLHSNSSDVDQKKRYKRLFKNTVLLTAIVSITPLIIMTVINYYQYQKAYKTDIIYPITRQTTNIKQALESFIDQRVSALKLIANEKNYTDLTDQQKITQTFRHIKESCSGFIDFSVIDSKGNQVAYAGPYNLLGKNYAEQPWFNETLIKGTYVSEVFLGFRKIPHFTISVLHEREDMNFYILRATIDCDDLYFQLLPKKLLTSSDVFLINKEGILQTPSRFHGKVLEKSPVPVPKFTTDYEVIETEDEEGETEILGYAFIENSPFILMETFKPETMMGNWLSGRDDLLLILAISVVVILIVIIMGARHMVRQIEISEQKRLKILHQIGYTNKMASIGRLAAGVSHEINNPLAIINENAGMISDIMSVTNDFPRKEKVTKHLNSIIKSVDRCSRITHRLLGFAKKIDTQTEEIRLEDLIKEVIIFLRREALARNINIVFNEESEDLKIHSDRGQLQQVFLNIINNAVDAVSDGGVIKIDLSAMNAEFVEVKISDNGKGIDQKDLDRIFEPFYTTKKESGTGLGLSITYGIVQKLGGKIDVKSSPGTGTVFNVKLPVNPPSEGI